MSTDREEQELFPDLDAGGALRAGFRGREPAREAPSRMPHAAPEAPGRAQHGYEMRGTIASGGMGLVVQAFDRELGRDVALKVLRDELVDEPALVRRFFEEARVTARLDHPGIVPVHEVGRDERGHPYFAMRLVRGRELRRIFELSSANEEGWNQARALSVMQKVCEAMAYAHGKGVIHRDLKPSNIMVGEFGEVYVMDWGLARSADGADVHDLRLRPSKSSSESRAAEADFESPIETMDGDVLGTPCYMPPEQAQGRVAELGPRSDVYAVGAMLYHLLAREMPYVPNGASVKSRAVLMQLVQGPPRPLRELAPDVPPELAAICEKAMARKSEERYADMLAMAEDVRAFLERRVVRAYESGALAEAKKWIHRNRGLSAALALAILALSAGLVASLVLGARAESSARTAVAERDKALKIASFLEDTFAGVSPAVAVGRDTTMLREMMDTAWKRVQKGELAAAPQAEARLMLMIGAVLFSLAEYDACEPILDQALEKARALTPKDDEVLGSILNWRGQLHRQRRRFDAAEACYREALELRRREYGAEHPEVAAILENMAALSEARGDLAAAEETYRLTLAMNRRLRAADSDEVAINAANLAVVLQARGGVDEPEPLFREAVEIQSRLFPNGHPHLSSSLNNLAALQEKRGDLDEAEKNFRRALEMRRVCFRADHPDVVVSLNNLAVFLYRRHRLEEAEPLFREAIAMQKRIVHADDPFVLGSLGGLAQLLAERGQDEEAKALYHEALGMQKRLHPGDQVDTASLESALGWFLLRRGDPAGARALFEEALEMRRRLYPSNHDLVLNACRQLANARHMIGDAPGAEVLLREALAAYSARDPAPTADIAATNVDLGLVLTKERRFADAAAALLAAEAALTPDCTATPLWRRACLERIAANFVAWDEAEPGQGIAERAAPWRLELAGPAAK